MKRKILFSPVGGTDPIKYCRDGSMLHICRFYKPDIVYLYMSHEMMENHRLDDRYVRSLNFLGELLQHQFEVHLIEKDDLVDVQQYDVFYRDFREEIRKIEMLMKEEDELIINMASGTPAMKSALLVLATLAEYRFRPIQVSTPLKKINSEYEDRDNYDIELNWEVNVDNEPDADNRCTEVECINLMKLLKIDMIRKHMGVYDYHAALTVAKEIKEDLPEEAFELLQIADARVKLNRGFISKINRDKRYTIYPVSGTKGQKLFEYALVLQMKVLKEEYADFIRGVTPIVVDLLEEILKVNCKIQVKDLCTISSKKVMSWDRNKLENAGLMDILDRGYARYGGFKIGPVYSGAMATLIRNISDNRTLIERVDDITRIEQQVRNVAAHEIVAVTDEWFIEKTGKSAKNILSIIKYLIGMAGIKIEKEDWNSYDQMNDLIYNYLK